MEATTSTIRVVIADDQELIRAGLAVMLDHEPDIEVVGQAGDGADAIAVAGATDPDVVLLDIRMPRLNGLQAARIILSRQRAKVVVLTTFDTDENVYEALRAGSSGFVVKDAPSQQIVAAVRSAAGGNALIDPSVTARFLAQFAQAIAPPPALSGGFAELTQREMEIVRLMARAMNNVEIANELVIEESTVKTHVGRILAKLGLRDRLQVVVLAYESGLVAPPAPERSHPGAGGADPATRSSSYGGRRRR